MAELTGAAAQARILLAARITLADIETEFADRIETREDVTFDAASGSLRARRSRRLGAVVLSEQPIRLQASDETARILAEGIAKTGVGRLPWTKSLTQWRDRVMFLRASEGEEWPDLSDAALARTASEWLAPMLASKTSLGEITSDELAAALGQLLSWPLQHRLDAEAPTYFEAPTGSRVPIDYEAEGGPKIAIRVQELFGLDRHPAIAGGQVPVADRVAVARAPAGANDARPARILARQLRRRADRNARPLPETPLARRSDRGDGDPPRQAAERLV